MALGLDWNASRQPYGFQEAGGFGDLDGFLGGAVKSFSDNRLPPRPGSSAVASTSRLQSEGGVGQDGLRVGQPAHKVFNGLFIPRPLTV